MLAATSTDIAACLNLARALDGTVYYDDRERGQHLPFRALLLIDDQHEQQLQETADCGLYRIETRELKVGNSDVFGLFPLVAHPRLNTDAALRHWLEVHGPLALYHHARMTSYTQIAVLKQISGPIIHGFALCGFASTDDLRERFFSHPESRTVIAEDIARFADVENSPPRLIARVETFV